MKPGTSWIRVRVRVTVTFFARLIHSPDFKIGAQDEIILRYKRARANNIVYNIMKPIPPNTVRIQRCYDNPLLLHMGESFYTTTIISSFEKLILI